MNSRTRPRPLRVAWFILAALMAAGVGVVLYSTPRGLGISPDSVQYVTAARGFLEGRGVWLELWAPLYPVALALGEWAGMDIFLWARLLNAALLGGNILLAALIIARHHPFTLLAPVIGAGLLLISEDIVTVHAWLWTEPLALFTGLLGLYWLDCVWERPKATALIPPALVLGLSCLIRYASLPFVAAGILGLFLLGKGDTARARSVRAGVFGAAAFLPFAAWGQYMLIQTGRVAGRSIQVRPSAPAELEAGLRIMADWILPGRLQGEALRAWVGAVMLLAWAAFALIVMVRRNRRRRGDVARGEGPHSADLLTLFVFAYALMIVGTRSFLTPSVAISHRIFSLAYAAMLVVAVSYAGHGLSWFRHGVGAPAWWRWAGTGVLAALLVAWAAFQATHTAKWLARAHADGLGYATSEWRDSPLIRYVRELPPGTPIYSNGPDAIYILTGIQAKMLPDWPGGPVRSGDPLPEAIVDMREELSASDGVIVYFRGITWRFTLSEVDLRRLLPLVPLFGTELGSIYGLTP